MAARSYNTPVVHIRFGGRQIGLRGGDGGLVIAIQHAILLCRCLGDGRLGGGHICFGGGDFSGQRARLHQFQLCLGDGDVVFSGNNGRFGRCCR